MRKIISKWILRLWGFKIKGEYPHHLKKLVIAPAPHTSYWDFPLGILVRTAIGARMNFVAKKSIFKPPFGWFFRWLGGRPVDRSKSTNYVDSVIEIFKKVDYFALVIAPEGTRKKVERLKTGFYYIALGAQVPIVLVRFDFKNKEVVFSDPFYPTGNKEEDFKFIRSYFRGVQGKHADKSLD